MSGECDECGWHTLECLCKNYSKIERDNFPKHFLTKMTQKEFEVIFPKILKQSYNFNKISGNLVFFDFY